MKIISYSLAMHQLFISYALAIHQLFISHSYSTTFISYSVAMRQIFITFSYSLAIQQLFISFFPHDTTQRNAGQGNCTRGRTKKKKEKERKKTLNPDRRTREAATLANAVALPVAVHKTPTPIIFSLSSAIHQLFICYS